MSSRTVPGKGHVAHFVPHRAEMGSLFIFNPQVVGSSPTAPRGVCAGQGLRARLGTLPEPPLGGGPVAHLWHIVTDACQLDAAALPSE